MDDLLPVAADDPLLPAAALTGHLSRALNWAPLDIEILGRFQGGNANICFAIRHGARDYVLRRPPAGKLPPKAHDMEREFQVLSQVHPQFDLAPEPVHFCANREVLGVPFLLMDRRYGTVLRGHHADQLATDPARNQAISRMMVDVLARFHAVSPEGMIAHRLGRPDGFLERQWQNWSARSRNQGLESDALRQISAWLEGNLPPQRHAGVVHNDFKLDNIMVASDDFSHPVALLDWDLCTVGDPLIDLGILLTYWVEAGDPEDWILGASMPTYVDGFLTRSEVIALYGERTGRSVDDILWYVIFGNFRAIVALAQIYARYQITGDGPPHFADMGRRIEILGQKCLSLLKSGL